MATAAQIASVRRMADEPGTEDYTDTALSALVDSTGSVESAVVQVWQEKAGRYAGLVNVSESGSSRSMSQMHTNALKMASYYKDLSKPEAEVTVINGPFVSEIERS